MCTPRSFVTLCTFSMHLPPTPTIYTLSLHDALPIYSSDTERRQATSRPAARGTRLTVRSTAAGHSALSAPQGVYRARDRKSTRLNSSHVRSSYAVLCLKKKKKKIKLKLNTEKS